MKQYLGPESAANSVRLSRNGEVRTFLLVESQRDVLILRPHVDLARCTVFPCHGRPNVIGATKLLRADPTPGVIGVIDADYDRVEGRPCPPGCVHVDFHDSEMMLIWSTALDRVVAEYGDPSRVPAFLEVQEAECLAAALTNLAAPLGYIRWANGTLGLGLNLRGLRYSRILGGAAMDAKLESIAKAICSASNKQSDFSALMDEVSGLKDLEAAPREFVNGHDTAAILGLALRRRLGNRDASEVKPDIVEAALRLAFDREAFLSTELATQLSDWSAKNSGWPLLRDM